MAEQDKTQEEHSTEESMKTENDFDKTPTKETSEVSEADTEIKAEDKPAPKTEEAAAADPDELDRVRKALAKANKEAQDRRYKLNEWDELGINPDTVKEWKKEREDEEIRKAEEEGRYQDIIEKTRTNATKDVEKANLERDSMKAQLEDYLVDKNLTEAISAEEGIPKLLQGIAREYVKTIQDESGKYSTVVLDEEGIPRKNEGGEPMNVRELVQSFKDDPELSYAFRAPKTSGSGSDGQGSATATGKTVVPKPKKSQMTAKDKQAFVSKHGYQELAKLPR